MSNQEKKILTNKLSGVVVLITYYPYAFGRYGNGLADANDLKFWTGAMLLFYRDRCCRLYHHHDHLPYSLCHRHRNYDDKEINRTIGTPMVEDEMDTLVGLKSSRIGFIFAGVGFVATLVSPMLGQPPFAMLNLLFFSFSIGSLAEGGFSIYYYRKGLKIEEEHRNHQHYQDIALLCQ